MLGFLSELNQEIVSQEMSRQGKETGTAASFANSGV